jgi:osmotically-inducible protein OsmY
MTLFKSFRTRLLAAACAAAFLVSLTLTAGCAPSVAAATDDASITARVRTVLMNDAEIGARSIEVETSSGVVTLSGVVRSPGEAERVLGLAREVEGVRDVRSTLEVGASGG